MFTGEMLSLLDGYADLEWVNNDKRKIAYAASFAKDTFSGTIEQKERLAYFFEDLIAFRLEKKAESSWRKKSLEFLQSGF